MTTIKGPDREKATGRYKHVDVFLVHDGALEIDGCDRCDRIIVRGFQGTDRKFKNTEAAYRYGAISDAAYVYLTAGIVGEDLRF